MKFCRVKPTEIRNHHLKEVANVWGILLNENQLDREDRGCDVLAIFYPNNVLKKIQRTSRDGLEYYFGVEKAREYIENYGLEHLSLAYRRHMEIIKNNPIIFKKEGSNETNLLCTS